LQRSGPIRVGAIGLGVGTLAVYARPGDVFRFYEINQEVERMAKKYFTFLADCRGEWDIVLGDARSSLESELELQKPQAFDLIVLDAFSGDAIPTHLLTREAFEIYRRHLTPNGAIAVHVSNLYLRLSPVVRRLAENCGMRISRIDDPGDTSRLQDNSTWVLVTRNDAFLKAIPSDPPDWDDVDCPAPLWTDQYSNLFQILKSPG
jgi:spermidine synthase